MKKRVKTSLLAEAGFSSTVLLFFILALLVLATSSYYLINQRKEQILPGELAQLDNRLIDGIPANEDVTPTATPTNTPEKANNVLFNQGKWDINYNGKKYEVNILDQRKDKGVTLHGFIFSNSNKLYLSYSFNGNEATYDENGVFNKDRYEKNHNFSVVDLSVSELELVEKVLAKNTTSSPLALRVPVSVSPKENYLLYIYFYEHIYASLYLFNINTGEDREIPITVNYEDRNYSWDAEEKTVNFNYDKLVDSGVPSKFETGQAKYDIKSNQVTILSKETITR